MNRGNSSRFRRRPDGNGATRISTVLNIFESMAGEYEALFPDRKKIHSTLTSLTTILINDHYTKFGRSPVDIVCNYVKELKPKLQYLVLPVVHTRTQFRSYSYDLGVSHVDNGHPYLLHSYIKEVHALVERLNQSYDELLNLYEVDADGSSYIYNFEIDRNSRMDFFDILNEELTRDEQRRLPKAVFSHVTLSMESLQIFDVRRLFTCLCAETYANRICAFFDFLCFISSHLITPKTARNLLNAIYDAKKLYTLQDDKFPFNTRIFVRLQWLLEQVCFYNKSKMLFIEALLDDMVVMRSAINHFTCYADYISMLHDCHYERSAENNEVTVRKLAVPPLPFPATLLYGVRDDRLKFLWQPSESNAPAYVFSNEMYGIIEYVFVQMLLNADANGSVMTILRRILPPDAIETMSNSHTRADPERAMRPVVSDAKLIEQRTNFQQYKSYIETALSLQKHIISEQTSIATLLVKRIRYKQRHRKNIIMPLQRFSKWQPLRTYPQYDPWRPTVSLNVLIKQCRNYSVTPPIVLNVIMSYVNSATVFTADDRDRPLLEPNQSSGSSAIVKPVGNFVNVVDFPDTSSSDILNSSWPSVNSFNLSASNNDGFEVPFIRHSLWDLLLLNRPSVNSAPSVDDYEFVYDNCGILSFINDLVSDDNPVLEPSQSSGNSAMVTPVSGYGVDLPIFENSSSHILNSSRPFVNDAVNFDNFVNGGYGNSSLPSGDGICYFNQPSVNSAIPTDGDRFANGNDVNLSILQYVPLSLLLNLNEPSVNSEVPTNCDNFVNNGYGNSSFFRDTPLSDGIVNSDQPSINSAIPTHGNRFANGDNSISSSVQGRNMIFNPPQLPMNYAAPTVNGPMSSSVRYSTPYTMQFDPNRSSANSAIPTSVNYCANNGDGSLASVRDSSLSDGIVNANKPSVNSAIPTRGNRFVNGDNSISSSAQGHKMIFNPPQLPINYATPTFNGPISSSVRYSTPYTMQFDPSRSSVNSEIPTSVNYYANNGDGSLASVRNSSSNKSKFYRGFRNSGNRNSSRM